MQKQKEQKRLVFVEISILIFIWIIIFASPLIFKNESDIIPWNEVVLNWNRLLPFLILTLFNHFILVPFIFFKKQKLLYFVCGIFTISLFVFTLNKIQKSHRPFNGIHPSENLKRLPPPQPIDGRGEFDRERRGLPGPMQPGMERGPGALPPYLNSVLIAILILGFDTGLRTTFKWTKLEQEREILEKEKVKTELAFLKNQISPHFFMNTLNNIHALIDISSEDAKESIIKLSKLMRYLLYDTEHGKTTLLKEVEFLKSYVDLMKLRFTKKVSVKLLFPETIPEIEISPMLFTSLIENSFKHGISYQNESFIEIFMEIKENMLHFRIKNSVHNNRDEEFEVGGIGLSNVQKRLELLYGSDFLIAQNVDEHSFEIDIKLPLNDNN